MAAEEVELCATPLVTIITATYNSSATLRLALQSVLQQDCGDFEAWVIGDACTDDSAAVVAALADPRLHWHNLPRNSGSQSAPNNEGLRRARGRYIAYIGHDDLWLPWHLSSLITQIEQSGADLAHSLCPLIGPAGVRDILGPPRDGVTYELHFVPPSAWLHRRALVDAIGGWHAPDGLSRGVDHDFVWRAARAGQRIVCAPTLSMLKFPSPWWRAYAPTSEPPQVAYWRAIEQDPHTVARQLLTEFVLLDARQYRVRGQHTPRVALRDAVDAAYRTIYDSRRALLDGYGRERWPLNFILPRLVRRRNQRNRRARGLA